jgi:hypothetical protein
VPYTRRAIKLLLSSGSPLSGKQKEKEKLKSELHEDPSIGHARKGASHAGKKK